MPGGVGGLGVVARRFARCDFAPAAHSVRNDFGENNSALVGNTETRLEGRLEAAFEFRAM